VQDEYGFTPLHFAARDDLFLIAKFLLENNADVNNQDNCDGATPLHLAASGNHSNAALWLINKKADVNLKDCRGSTPLDWAEQGVIKMLRDEGATRGKD
jgi:ankyrin repeat protein